MIIACVRHGKTAALAAPFRAKDTALMTIISSFDTAYSAYNDFQQGIERYWTLRWLEQNQVGELEAAVMKEGLVRAETLPLVFRVPGTDKLTRGSRVRVRVQSLDLLTLEVHAQLLTQIAAEPDQATAGDAEADDDAVATGGLNLAIALDEPDAAETLAQVASA